MGLDLWPVLRPGPHDPRDYSPSELERLVKFWCDLPTADISVVCEPDPPELWVLYVNGKRKSQHETKNEADLAAVKYTAKLRTVSS